MIRFVLQTLGELCALCLSMSAILMAAAVIVRAFAQ